MKSNTAKIDSSTFWENYYATHREPTKCSLFAEFVQPFLKEGKKLIDCGCGNARDSIFFAQNGVNVLAVDQCSQELDFLEEKFKDIQNLNFLPADMTRLPKLEPLDYAYSRFTIHAIDKEGEDRLIKWVSENILQNGLFFIEVRSVKDDLFGQGEALPDNAFFSDHYRRFIKIRELEAKLEANDFRIMYSLEAKGLAPFKTKDPVVIRLIAQKK